MLLACLPPCMQLLTYLLLHVSLLLLMPLMLKHPQLLLLLFVSLSLLESLVHTVAGLPALAVGIPVDCGVPTIVVKHIKLLDYGCRTDNIFSSEYHNLEYL
jgi:hypothetical protein